jgi:putative ABC transport system ATP-binding protein
MRLFEQLHAAGRTVIVVTHDPRVAELTHRQIHLLDGRIVLDGLTTDIKAGTVVPASTVWAPQMAETPAGRVVPAARRVD